MFDQSYVKGIKHVKSKQFEISLHIIKLFALDIQYI